MGKIETYYSSVIGENIADPSLWNLFICYDHGTSFASSWDLHHWPCCVSGSFCIVTVGRPTVRVSLAVARLGLVFGSDLKLLQSLLSMDPQHKYHH